jgi:Protein of unknown function DUF2617
VLVDLDVEPIDQHAAMLRLSIDAPSNLRALVTVRIGNAIVEILGGSHRVSVTGPGVSVVEELSCGSANEAADTLVVDTIPARIDIDPIVFVSAVDRLQPEAFAVLAEQLRNDVGGDHNGIVGVFPGHRNALTAIQVHQTDNLVAGWRTWHCYSETCEVVMTTTTLRPAS